MSDNFFQYLKPIKSSLNTKRLVILGGITILGSIFTTIKSIYELEYDTVKSYLEDPKLLDILFYTNILLFLIICLWLVLQKPPKDIFYNISKLYDFDGTASKETSLMNFVSNQKFLEQGFERANDSVKEFIRWFKFIWIGWFILYAITVYFRYQEFHFVESILLNAANNLTSLFFLFCLLVLNENAVKKKEAYRVKIDPKWFLIFGILIVLEVVSHSFFPDYHSTIAKAFAVISGLIAMIAMSLLLGRLDSKLIDKLPMSILAVLYGYAGIQLFLPIFLEQNQTNQLSLNLILIIYLALFCKIVLLVFIYWMVDTNRLFFYFLAVFRIHNNINKEWLQIKDAFLSKSKVINTDLSGKWRVYEYYFSKQNYGGFVTGEMNLKYFQGAFNGVAVLKDGMQPLTSKDKVQYFKVSQKVKVTIDIEGELTFQGDSPKIISKNIDEMKDENYKPDKWVGIQIDDKIVIGWSKDENGVQGNFYFEKTHDANGNML